MFYERDGLWLPLCLLHPFSPHIDIVSTSASKECVLMIWTSTIKSEIWFMFTFRSRGSETLHRLSTTILLLPPCPFTSTSQSITIGLSFHKLHDAVILRCLMVSLGMITVETSTAAAAFAGNLKNKVVSFYGLCSTSARPTKDLSPSFECDKSLLFIIKSIVHASDTIEITLCVFAILTEFNFSVQSSLNFAFSTSSLERPHRILGSSNHNSTNTIPRPVNHKRCTSSPSILPLDVYVIFLARVSKACSYSSSTLLMNVCDVMSGLENIVYRTCLCICSAYHSSSTRTLALTSLWSKTNPKLMNLGDMYCFLVSRRSVLCRIQFLNLNISIGPSATSLDQWLVYHDPWVIHLALGGEGPTDDLLSVYSKGLTLVSAAEFKIVKSVLEAVTITDGCSCDMSLTSARIIVLTRLNDEETRGHLFAVRLFGIMNLSILCLLFFRLLFASPIVLERKFLEFITIDVIRIFI